MRPLFPLVLAALLFSGCSNSSPVDGRTLNSVVTLRDLFTSAFLVPTDNGAVLVDAGFRANRIEAAVQAAGFAPDAITDILLTHGHGDHTVAIERFPNATVRALAAEQPVLDEEGVTLDVALEPGLITLSGVEFEVFPTPGHTPGNAMFLVDRVLLMGDSAIGNTDGTLGPTGDNFSDDPEALNGSVRAVAAILAERTDPVDFLAPAHSDALSGLQPLLDY